MPGSPAAPRPGAPAAPSAADVTVTLKSYKKVDSICDGAGWKKTTADGEGWDVPNDGAKCVASWTAKTTDGTHRLLEETSELPAHVDPRTAHQRSIPLGLLDG